MANWNRHSLSIVIPALNEEEAIGATIERCLAARQCIEEEAGLDETEIIVVSDGSTDRTAEISRGYEGVRVIEFELNRGYGAAIKQGWHEARGDLLGFLDADGTCDPLTFASMCRVALEESADVVLGSRLGPNSKMPPVRRIGNRIYAALLGLACGRQVTDTASGMRVVRRDALRWLYPLPDGLHFTPSMSAKALLNDLRIVEIPMSYQERIGISKLHVVRDGVTFLRSIFSSVLCYAPERFLLTIFAFCMVTMGLLAAYPIEFYLANRRLEEWMIYRFVVCSMLGNFGLLLLLAVTLAFKMSEFGPRRVTANAFWPYAISSVLRGGVLIVMLASLTLMSLLFLWPGLVEYTLTGHVSLHWSRLLAGSFTLTCAFQTAIFALLLKVLAVWKKQFQQMDRASRSSPVQHETPTTRVHERC